jgi:hypothetical protein
MKGPQTKGLLLVSVVADIRRMVDEGRIARDDLEGELRPDVLKLVDGEVSPVSWYDSDVYPQLVGLLMRFDGKGPGDLDYVRERGERAGEKLVESGLYQQMDYMKRRVAERKSQGYGRREFEKSMRMIVSMPSTLMKGGTWSVQQDPDHEDRVMIVVDDVTGLSEESAVATQGILSGVSHAGGSGFRFLYERPRPSRILYRMDRDISALGRGDGA